jgi:hypothetical protein
MGVAACVALDRYPGEGSCGMPKEPVQIEVVQEDDECFIVKTFADGSEERVPIVKLPRKPPRWPYRKVSFDKSRKKGF